MSILRTDPFTFKRAYTLAEDLPGPISVLKDGFWKTVWGAFSGAIEATVAKLVAVQSGMDSRDSTRLTTALIAAARAYERIRAQDSLWKECLGKQMLAEVSGKLGFKGPEFLEANVLQMWANGELPIPAEVTVVQDFLKQL